MKRSICIITGDNERSIQKELHSKIRLCVKNNLQYYKVLFPEDRKHSKEYCKNVKDIILNNEDCNIIIATFSEQIVNLIGEMISDKVISEKETILYITASNDKTIESNYDNEGYLENYPIGYFNWTEF